MTHKAGPQLPCPNCGEAALTVTDSRVAADRSLVGAATVRRRRTCSGCGYRYTTYEITEDKLRHIHREAARELVRRIGPELLAAAEGGR